MFLSRRLTSKVSPAPEILCHHLWPPQNEPGPITSGYGPGTHQWKEPILWKTKTLLQKHWEVCSNIHLHSRPGFNFIQILDTKNTIEQNYQFSLTDMKNHSNWSPRQPHVSLLTISSSIEDFLDTIKVFPQMTKITLSERPKQFVAIGKMSLWPWDHSTRIELHKWTRKFQHWSKKQTFWWTSDISFMLICINWKKKLMPLTISLETCWKPMSGSLPNLWTPLKRNSSQLFITTKMSWNLLNAIA